MDELTKKTIQRQPITERDKIINFMTAPPGTIILTETEFEIYQRVEYAYENLHEFTDKEVKEMLMKRFGISKSSAYTAIGFAYDIHQKTGQFKKDVELHFTLQDCRKAIKRAYDADDTELLIKAIAAKSKILKLLPDQDKYDWKKILPSNYYLMINVNNANGESTSLKLDMKKFVTMTEDERDVLQQQFAEQAREKQRQILLEDDEQ